MNRGNISKMYFKCSLWFVTVSSTDNIISVPLKH